MPDPERDAGVLDGGLRAVDGPARAADGRALRNGARALAAKALGDADGGRPDAGTPLLTRPFAAEPAADRLPLTADPGLGSCLEALSARPELAGMGMALVDLTGVGDDRAPPAGGLPYAGVGDGTIFQVDSLPKMAVMAALFRLRAQVRAAAAEAGEPTAEVLFPRLRREWGSEVSRAEPGRSPDFPRLEQAFGDEARSLAEADFTLELRDALEEMISASGNDQAAAVVRSLGFQYLNGALRAEGLGCSGGRNGFFVALDWGKRTWGSGPWPAAQGATPRAAAAMLALLHLGRLVDGESSEEMVYRLRRASPNVFEKAIGPKDAWGKVGYITRWAQASFLRRGVLARRADGGTVMKEVSYVAVGMNAPGRQQLEAFAAEVDTCMVKRYETVP